MNRLLAVAVGAGAGLLGLVVAAGPAAAHAELVSTDPAPGARVEAAPRQATLRFTEPVALIDGGVRLLDRTGRVLPMGEPRHDAGVVVVPLPSGLADGGYLLAWRVVSIDSHPVHGVVPFTVGQAADLPPPGTAELGASGESARRLLILARWAGFVGVVLLLGPAAFVVLCWPAGMGDETMRRLFAYGAGTVAAAAVIGVPLQAAYVTGRPLSTALSPSELWPVLQSAFGQAATARVALVAVLAVVMSKAWDAGRWSPPTVTAMALATVGMLGTFAMSGHAAGASFRGLALLSDTVHLAAMACWLGGLVALATRLLPHTTMHELYETLPRWSRTAMSCVALLAVTGGYQTWREVGTLPALTGTPYGRLLLVKLAGVAALLFLGNLGRVWVQRHAPAIPLPAGHAAERSLGATTAQIESTELRQLRRSVAAEVGIGVAVLGVTAALVATTPGRSAIRAPQTPAGSGTTATRSPSAPVSSSMTLPGGIHVTVTADPPVAAAAVLEVRVEKPSDAPANPLEVRAVAAQPERGLTGLPLPLHPVGPGRYAAHDTTLPFPGRWRITVTVRTSDVDAGVGTTTITLR